MRHFRLLCWMFSAVIVFAACDDDSGVQVSATPLDSPEVTVSEGSVRPTSFRVEWMPVENAATYACKVTEKATAKVVHEATVETYRLELRTLPVDGLTPETAYIVSVTSCPATGSEEFTDSEPGLCEVVTPDDPNGELPGDMFDIELGVTSADGIQFTFRPHDPLMLYTDILVEESYITEDGLTDYDFAEQIIYVSNQMLSITGSLEGAMAADFFYLGPVSDTGLAGHTVGLRCFFAVMGVEYDEATNTVKPATKVSRSEVFTITDEPLPQEIPWADFVEPAYTTRSGENVLEVKVVGNSVAQDDIYGKVYPADYRSTHSDSEIISYLTSVSNMYDTWISSWNPYLRGAAAPGERLLFAVATLDRNGAVGSKLNWVILEAPAAVGGEVKIVDAAKR